MAEGSFISDALAQPSDAIFHQMTVSLSEAFPDKYLLESQSHFFSVAHFAHARHCTYNEKPGRLTQWDWDWEAKHGSHADAYNGWFEVEWQGNSFELVLIGRQEGHCRAIRHYLIADSQEVASLFFAAVCEWNAEVRGEVLVFDQGHWYKSSDLFASIQTASFDGLVLEGDLKNDLQEDTASFFRAKETYDRYGIAWKRGVLLLGPPGNGKTHAVKALINTLGKPSLYVKSFSAEYQTDQDCIGKVFERARDTAPCILILEDLDSLINGQNRSFFLNEMDGFASNDGILTLATTNHPERLDPAILERPSRFDRKYIFNLPAPPERAGYLAMFSTKLEPELRLSHAGIQLVADATDGYSFAYLKELYLSSMMKWIASPGAVPIDQIMVSQSELLRSQMTSEAEMPEHFSDDDAADHNPFAAMTRQMMRRYRSRPR